MRNRIASRNEGLELMLSMLSKGIRDALRANHRRMLVLCGNDNAKLGFIAGIVTKCILEILGRYSEELRVLYAKKPGYEDAKVRFENFKGIVEKLQNVELDVIGYAETERVLGTTYDMVILDLINDLRPNDVGRLVGIVRGGGLLIMLTPPLDEWENRTTEFQRLLSTPQHPVDEVRKIFIKRFIKKLYEHKGIMIYDVDEDIILKPLERLEVKEPFRREVKIPERTKFGMKIYRLALTQDQVEALLLMEKLFRKPKKGRKIAIVLTADRGRGKSCAVGIGIASLAHLIRRRVGKSVFIAVTAPSIANVQSLMMLAKRTLETLDYNVKVEMFEGMIRELRADGIAIKYMHPIEAIDSKADIIAADEAAGLQVPMLHRIWKKYDRAIFSSTIHGYEGAGRGFSIRFLKTIKEDPNTKVLEYEMEEPIRYAANDPIENWLFDTLLLDAEPARLTSEDFQYIDKGVVEYIEPSLEELFLKKEDMLRQFVGIYILAHYRNRPNDLAMMADAPHHTIRALILPSGKVVTAVELAEEGPIPDDMIDDLKRGGWIQGNVIPDRFLKHARDERFAKYAGWRIVRIATHPSAMDRGLGTIMIKHICEEAKRRGYGWVGAGFGVNEPLLRFWLKNGFIPIHISPDRNPVSGEYTVIVVKPLNDEVHDIIMKANREFRLKLLHSLADPYDDLEPRVARMLLMTWGNPIIRDYRPRLTDVQLERAITYAWGPMTYESASDCVRELALTYFYNDEKNRPALNELQELILIAKVLQARSWRYAAEDLDVAPQTIMNGLKEIVRIMLRYYYNLEKVPRFYTTERPHDSISA